LSIKATQSSDKATQDILCIKGQRALSEFRIKKLNSILKEVHAELILKHAAYRYYVKLNDVLESDELDRLSALLLSGERVIKGNETSNRITVVPRIGTISSWSSKATDIVHACALHTVERIERGVCFFFNAPESLETKQMHAIQKALHDRMTESVLTEDLSVAALFAQHKPQPLISIELTEKGKKALEEANQDLGLALSDDEIDYLCEHYEGINRDPTDAELMMFAQANSEHCRHKIFNAEWVIDGEPRAEKLFSMIKSTTKANPKGVISAYSDNAAVIEGFKTKRLMSSLPNREFVFSDEPVHIVMKVETHNHPTAISPFAGAATGSGGEIRDEGATGLGAKPKAGLTGFTVSHLRIPDYPQPWERAFAHPERMATPLEIMTDGPLGGAAFNNEFGRPNLLGYFRTFEAFLPELPENEIRGYHKPIMIAGGVGNVRDEHALKIDIPQDAEIIVIGGPAMLIGLGGGAASSLASGSSSEDLDFASVQRGNPEIERRAQEVIDRCASMGNNNPILLIHDIGAGGLSNAIPEAVDHSKHGALLELREVDNAEPGMSPMAIWCNEAQERYVLVINQDRREEFIGICKRERCPYSLVGTLNDSKQLTVTDRHFEDKPVDIPMDVLLGKPPKMQRVVERVNRESSALDLSGVKIKEAIYRVLKFPAVADKSFLIHIGDRTVGGLSVRDQLVGPWQVPVSDVAITASGFESKTGEAMSMGERTPLAVINAPASGRMAVGEAITNIAAASIGDLSKVKLSANWMAAAGHPGEDANLFDTVKAISSDLCKDLGVAIPVGKDSLSMRTSWQEEDKEYQVVAPVSLIVSAFAPVTDVRNHLTPDLKRINGRSRLLLIDLGQGTERLGGSVLAQVYNLNGGYAPDIDTPLRLKAFFEVIQALLKEKLLLAYHDRSDGGLLATITEMMFGGHLGASLKLSGSAEKIIRYLFNEELGGVVQVAQSQLPKVKELLEDKEMHWVDLGEVEPDEQLTLHEDDEVIFRANRVQLQRAWSETSYRIQSQRDNPITAKEEYDRILDQEDPGMSVKLSFDLDSTDSVALVGGQKPKIAILREQGVNSQYEMAAAFMRAGFESVDVHMSDLFSGADTLDNYHGMVACGGFSYGDVLGAGGGWAKSILYNSSLRDQFSAFFARDDSFSLGICNGCQMLSHLKELIPGAECWPHFKRNKSEQFEARFGLVKVADTNSIFLTDMTGSRLPIATSHGEGRAVFDSEELQQQAQDCIAVRYVDNYGNTAESYPANPNGSIDGICGLTSLDGRATIIMPHPERVARTTQNSWHPDEWGEEGPWFHMFKNARRYLD
tara:strand:+ start:6182 stop:10105 length:3924 start_codon:yes stop_codon:yes gene_type:complete